MGWESITIYLDKPVQIKKALEIITDDYEDYCQQTVIDLRDACLNLISIIEDPTIIEDPDFCKGCVPPEEGCEECEYGY
jgi:hypothetical protein